MRRESEVQKVPFDEAKTGGLVDSIKHLSNEYIRFFNVMFWSKCSQGIQIGRSSLGASVTESGRTKAARRAPTLFICREGLHPKEFK